MSKTVFTIIPESYIPKISKTSKPEVYHSPFQSVYFGQIPNFSFFLHSGSVKLTNKDNSLIIKQPGLFNLKNILEKKTSHFTIEILKNSKISSLDKHQIQILKLDKFCKNINYTTHIK